MCWMCFEQTSWSLRKVPERDQITRLSNCTSGCIIIHNVHVCRSDADTDIWSDATEQPEEVISSTPDSRSCERKRNPAKWRVNVRKRKRHCEEYADRHGKIHPARKVAVKKNCAAGCLLNAPH